jgi:hypothetical protein
MHLFRSLAVLGLALILVPSPAWAGNSSGPTRTQTYQPGEPFTGLPGGAPGRGYGSGPSGTPYGVGPSGTPYGVGPSGVPSVYCQNWPGHSPYPQYPGTGPNTPCGPNFQPAPPPPPPLPLPPPSETTGCQSGPSGSLDAPRLEQGGIILVEWNQPVAPSNWDQWLNGQNPPGLNYQIWKAQNEEITKPLYGTNKPFLPGGYSLNKGVNWKRWWSTSNVCVWVTLRCFGKKDSQSRGGLIHSGLWKSTCKVLQEPQIDTQANYSYWLFLKNNVLPKVLPDDNIVPPWPQDQSGQPCPKSNMQYVNGNPAYFDLPYTFTETVKPTSRAPYRGSQPRGSGSDQCQ